VTPIWYLAVEYGSALPDALKFLIPDEPGALPIILQLFIAEIALDGLKLASMNTPDMLSNSLSVVGALILGDFAVGIGWFSEDVIFYMACVAIANFAQQNHELGYAFKFMRLIILTLVYFFGIYGFIIGLMFFVATALMNSTPANLRGYLYPLIPFAPRAMLRHLFRFKKKDVEN
jgi:stage V sporulation protein AF